MDHQTSSLLYRHDERIIVPQNRRSDESRTNIGQIDRKIFHPRHLGQGLKIGGLQFLRRRIGRSNGDSSCSGDRRDRDDMRPMPAIELSADSRFLEPVEREIHHPVETDPIGLQHSHLDLRIQTSVLIPYPAEMHETIHASQTTDQISDGLDCIVLSDVDHCGDDKFLSEFILQLLQFRHVTTSDS